MSATPLHERQADRVETPPGGEGENLAVLLGEGADAEIECRQVMPLRDRSSPPTCTLTVHLVAGDALDYQLDEAVVQEDAVARFDGPGARPRR